MRVSFLESSNGIKVPQDLSFGYYNLLQACFLEKYKVKPLLVLM